VTGTEKDILIIGCGAAGTNHAQILVRQGHRLSLHDEDAGQAQRLGTAMGLRVVADCEGDYDLAVVAVPTRYHAECIAGQLERGRDVISEKPLCLYPGEAEEVINLAESAGPNLCVAESQGYGGITQGMGTRLQIGEFGRPVLWRINAMSPYRSQEWSYDIDIGGGAFLEGGVHMLTVARAFFGEAVAWSGTFQSYQGGTGPDTGALIIEYEQGDAVMLSIGWGTKGCQSGECEPLVNAGGIIGPEKCEPFWTQDNHSDMWAELLPAIEAGEQPYITTQHAAGAVADVWKCYAAGGYYPRQGENHND